MGLFWYLRTLRRAKSGARIGFMVLLPESAGVEVFLGFGLEMLELAADGKLLDVAESVDEQLAGQMVHLVLGGAGEKSVELRFRGLAVEPEVFDDDAPRTFDVPANVGEAQAAFFHAAGFVGLLDNLRIDEGEGEGDVGIEAGTLFVFHVVAFGDFDDADGFGAADLLGGGAFNARVIEDTLRAARVPYVIVGDVSFYNRREIKDIVAYLRVVVNNADDVNVRRIVNVPARGIGETTQETIARHARAQQLSFFGALEHTADIAQLTAGTRRNITNFMKLLHGLQQQAATLRPTEMINQVIDQTGYLDALAGSEDMQDRARVENVRELISAAAEYEKSCPDERPGLQGFLQEIALTSELDKWNDTNAAVTLMTMHTAKGLEFPVVFMAGMEEDLFPHFNSLEDPTDVEEERRLCYVGMTRAEQRLTMTCAYHRTIFGQRKVREPSRFLSELPAEQIETQVSALHEELGAVETNGPVYGTGRGAAGGAPYGAAAAPANGEYKPGQRVTHAHFGAGRIESVMGGGDDARLTIKFDSLPNPKVLVAKYAKLRGVR